jgi:hypothetical protein
MQHNIGILKLKPLIMKNYYKPLLIALALNCSLHTNILAQPLEAYFDRFYSVQPNLTTHGGMTVCVAVESIQRE